MSVNVMGKKDHHSHYNETLSRNNELVSQNKYLVSQNNEKLSQNNDLGYLKIT